MSIQQIKDWIKDRSSAYPILKKYYRMRYKSYFPLKDKYIPKIIQIETTNLCNAKCSCCPHTKMTRGKGNMPWELFKKIVDQCEEFAGCGLKIYLHKDGEPLLDPFLFERIAYIKEKLPQVELHFNSNAFALTQEKAEKLTKLRVDGIIFSVDGASKNTYEKIRVGLDYDTVKRNLDTFFELKKKNLNKTYVTMQMVVSDVNRHELETYKKLWIAKADMVVFKPMHNFLDMGTSTETKKLDNNQLRFCTQPIEVMVIYWNGDLGLCCWDYDNVICLGNLGQEKLIDAYNNQSFKKVRKAMYDLNCKDISPCNKCSIIYGKDKFEFQQAIYNSL